MEKSVERKLEELRKHIRRLDSSLASCAGMVDNSFLMRICREELGEKALSVKTLSDYYPKGELSMAGRVAKIMGARNRARPADVGVSGRKSSLPTRTSQTYSSLKSLAMRTIMRKALRSQESGRIMALREAGIRSPILETGVSKAEVRLLAKELGLPNWERAKKKPWQIRAHRKAAAVERYLDSIGFKDAEVSVVGGKAYVAVKDVPRFIRRLSAIKKKVKSLGLSGVLLLLS